jgi:hypothetical protein
MYKEPKNLISKDTMVNLLTDMYLASSANNSSLNKLKKQNYMILVYQKYKIDTTRFFTSNQYYTSKIELYSEIFKKVKRNLDSLHQLSKKEVKILDSIKRIKDKNDRDSILKKGKKQKVIKQLSLKDSISWKDSLR